MAEECRFPDDNWNTLNDENSFPFEGFNIQGHSYLCNMVVIG